MLNQGSVNRQRFITITFDDGLIEGARKALKILDEFNLKATFYVVTGWVRPRRIPWIRDCWNKGRDHGSWADWRGIQHRGHEIGSHTVTHINAGGKWARLVPGLMNWELIHSHRQLERHLGRSPVSISMPWNTPTRTAEPVVRRTYAACRLGGQAVRSNDLSQMDWHRLQSWAPDANIPADEIIECVRATPPGHWLILQFHSFDGEGYMPLTVEKFQRVMRGIGGIGDLQTVTVRQMVERFQNGARRAEKRKAARTKKRVCLITSEHLATNPRLVKEADALSAAGFDVRVVSCMWMDWARREDARLLESRCWRNEAIDYAKQFSRRLFWHTRLRHHATLRLFARWWPGEKILKRAAGRAAPEMTRLAANEPADLFIGHNLAALPAAVLAARRRGVPAAFDAEDFHSGMWLKEQGPQLADRLARRVEAQFLPECRHITAAAPLIAEAYAREYGLSLPVSILNVFPLADRPKEFRACNPQAPLTLYWFSQTIGARRGLEEIIRGIALTGSKGIQLHLRGQWQAGYERTLRRLAAAAGLEPAQLVAHELAPPDDMIRLSSEYDVGLALEHPVSENRDICLTNKICTYLLAGNAVIATATRGQRHLMKEIPGAGLCYEIGDVSVLAAQLCMWERDRSALEAMRRRAWQFGGERFNWDVEQKKLLEVVEGVFRQAASRD